MLGGAQQGPKPPFPFLDVEVMLVLKGPPEHRRELVERLEQLACRLPQRLELEARIGRPHVLENALLGARGHDRLLASLDEDVGALSGPPAFFDGHQTEDSVRAPILAVPEEYHAPPLHIHTITSADASSGFSECLLTQR